MNCIRNSYLYTGYWMKETNQSINYAILVSIKYLIHNDFCSNVWAILWILTVHKRRAHKISNPPVCAGSTHLFVQTRHKFRKIRRFCTKKCGRPHLKNSPLVRTGKNPFPWLQTSFMDSPKAELFVSQLHFRKIVKGELVELQFYFRKIPLHQQKFLVVSVLPNSPWLPRNVKKCPKWNY